ncbi:MAG: hypothetical protein LBJ78_04490 [Puniceicoccales bacterium]|jgi:hypothetical protein|nr:hypothetical protein [Puniceicoccales bacterium]
MISNILSTLATDEKVATFLNGLDEESRGVFLSSLPEIPRNDFLRLLPESQRTAFLRLLSGEPKGPFLSLLSKKQREAFLWGCCMGAYQSKYPEVTQATYLEDLKNDHGKHDYLPNIRDLFVFLVGRDTNYPEAGFTRLTDDQINAFEWGQRICYMWTHEGDTRPSIGLTRDNRNMFILGGLFYGQLGTGRTPEWNRLAKFMQENTARVNSQAIVAFKWVFNVQ